MAYKCVIRLLDKSGRLIRTHHSKLLYGAAAVSYARRMTQIYGDARVSLKYALIARGGVLSQA